MFTHVVLVLLNAVQSLCSAEFEMFPGFEANTPVSLTTYMNNEETEPPWVPGYVYTEKITTTTTTTELPTNSTTTIGPPSFECLEKEKPSNIGPYEVPSEKDLVLLVKKALVERFRRYNRKTLNLLKHIKEATKSAKLRGKKCNGKQKNYRICLMEVNRHATSETKNLMTMVEDINQNITFFTKGKICNMAAMKPNPLLLVKKMAVEEANLKFALPAFLRVLNECHNIHCKGNFSNTTAEKPRRRLSDPEFLIKYILTNNSLELINDLK